MFIAVMELIKKSLTHCVLAMPCSNIDLGNIGLGNGLLPDTTKPLPELMLTYHQWDPATIDNVRVLQFFKYLELDISDVFQFSWILLPQTLCA